MEDHPIRPATPQPLFHRLPDLISPLPTPTQKPNKFIILLTASATVPGKLQIAQSVARTLACPLYQGDSLHDTAAKAARVGASARGARSAEASVDPDGDGAPSVNEARYQRMWLSKLTRTGLLFPRESRAALSGFAGFGGRRGSSSTAASGSRRGSESSGQDIDSEDEHSSVASSAESSIMTAPTKSLRTECINRPPSNSVRDVDEGNAAVMVLTHPVLERWQRKCIREAVGEYGIGVVLVPLDADTELPVLKVLDPKTVAGFTSFVDFVAAARRTSGRDWSDEITLHVDTDSTVEEIVQEIVEEVRSVLSE